jgi:hypothetical protein
MPKHRWQKRSGLGRARALSGVVANRMAVFPHPLPSVAPWTRGAFRSQPLAAMFKVPFHFSGNCMARSCGLGRVHMQTLALISFYPPVVIIILAVVAVLFSFFWVFLSRPHMMSNAMGRLLIRFWRWREQRQR